MYKVNDLDWYSKEIAKNWRAGSIVLTKRKFDDGQRYPCDNYLYEINTFFRPDWLQFVDCNTQYALIEVPNND